MAQNVTGRLSREAFRQFFQLLADRIGLEPREEAILMSFLESVVFADELADHIEEGH